MNKREFTTIKKSSYSIPNYFLEKGVGLVPSANYTILDFVKGDFDGTEVAHSGIVMEGLLCTIIHHLNELNVGELRSRETSLAVTKLEEALFWLEERQRDRTRRNVVGTYKQ